MPHRVKQDEIPNCCEGFPWWDRLAPRFWPPEAGEGRGPEARLGPAGAVVKVVVERLKRSGFPASQGGRLPGVQVHP